MTQVILHGHTYQPPRENPFTGVVPHEVSAAPFHDWNERIARECYRPMAWARITDDRNRVVDIVNLFASMSFDLGPTLAEWLAVNVPDVHERIVAAGRSARTAIAHPYHHTILPLADGRDRETELQWGLADFRHRFGRDPDAVWLPEAAVDDATLVSVRAAGIGLVPLLSDQVAGGTGGAVYQWSNPSGGADVDLILADPGFSRELAFGVFGGSSEWLVRKAEELAQQSGAAFAMTDTETFGHHHRFTERTLAYALGSLGPQRGLTPASLDAVARTSERRTDGKLLTSSWSCAHGLARWWRECGCDNGAGGQQHWRTPLRAALDVVRRSSRSAFIASDVFEDHWAARNAFGRVVVGTDGFDDAVGPYLRRGAGAQERTTARLLLESQRHALAMYTSCAWFFEDLMRLEPLISLRNAARCLDLLAIAAPSEQIAKATDEMLAVLSTAVANDGRTGADLWHSQVTPARFEWPTSAPPLTADELSMRMVVDAVATAVASGAPGDIAAASERLRVDGTGDALERAQELLFDALLGQGPEHRLVGLGAQAGLAVEAIVSRDRPAVPTPS